MRKRSIALAIVIILAGATYFTKSVWMEDVIFVQDELQILESGTINTGLVDNATSSPLEKSTYTGNVITKALVDIGISNSIDNSNKRYNMGLLNDWKENYDFYCTFPPASICDGSEGCTGLIPLWDTDATNVIGELECSDQSILGFTLKKKDGEGQFYEVSLDNLNIKGLEHPRDCREVCPLTLYGKGDYLVKVTGRGDADCGFSEELWYNKKQNIESFEMAYGGCTGPHDFTLKKENTFIEIAPILSDKRNIVDEDKGIECKEYTFAGFTLKKNNEIIETFSLPQEKVCFSFGENIGAHGEFNADINKIEVRLDRLGISLNIDATTLDYILNDQ